MNMDTQEAAKYREEEENETEKPQEKRQANPTKKESKIYECKQKKHHW